MLVNRSVTCPYCTRECELEIDTTEPEQEFEFECQSCGQAFQVRVECLPGEIVDLEVTEL